MTQRLLSQVTAEWSAARDRVVYLKSQAGHDQLKQLHGDFSALKAEAIKALKENRESQFDMPRLFELSNALDYTEKHRTSAVSEEATVLLDNIWAPFRAAVEDMKAKLEAYSAQYPELRRPLDELMRQRQAKAPEIAADFERRFRELMSRPGGEEMFVELPLAERGGGWRREEMWVSIGWKSSASLEENQARMVRQAEEVEKRLSEEVALVTRVQSGLGAYPRLLQFLPGAKGSDMKRVFIEDGEGQSPIGLLERIKKAGRGVAGGDNLFKQVSPLLSKAYWAIQHPSPILLWLRQHAQDDDPWTPLVKGNKPIKSFAIAPRGTTARVGLTTDDPDAAAEEEKMLRFAIESTLVRIAVGAAANRPDTRKTPAAKRRAGADTNSD